MNNTATEQDEQIFDKICAIIASGNIELSDSEKELINDMSKKDFNAKLNNRPTNYSDAQAESINLIFERLKNE
jgi:hypothetical protein